MKKLFVSIAATLLLVAFAPIQSNAASEKNPNSIENASPEVKAMINRVNEINAMDRSAMSASEKKEIRKELRTIKREVNRNHGGTVYISGGVILLIIVLIILL
jgi:hypothetical protein